MKYIILPFAALVILLSAQPITSQVRTAPVRARQTPKTDFGSHLKSMHTDLIQLDQSHQKLKQTAERLSALYAELSKRAEAASRNSPQAGRQLQETLRRQRVEFSRLQKQIQQESRRYQATSNVIKSSHDAAMNSIRNVK